jgi:hypothetical protein
LARSPEPSRGQVSGGGESSDGKSVTSGSEGRKGSRLDQAARSWVKKGYSVRYRDSYLIQLVKRRWPAFWLLVPLVALGVAAVMLIVSLARRLLGARWHVVELTETPDKRIIMHRMWARRPPDD